MKSMYKKGNVLPFVILAVLVLGFAGYIFFGDSKGRNSEIPAGETQETENSNPTPDEEESSDKYITYSTGSLEAYPEKRRVLFFYANWCPTCRPADADFIKNVGKIPGDVILFRVNYNDTETETEEKSLANKYGVTYQHTFVQIDEDGNALKTWNGGQTKDLLDNII